MSSRFLFFFNAFAFGIGLSMDAFSVSLANGLHEPSMTAGRMAKIAAVFGIFQMVMPMTGWICVHTIAETFSAFQKFIPWIALILLCYIGGKMLLEGIRPEAAEEGSSPVGLGGLLVQGIATSIDALSVGFTISDYRFREAIAESIIIGIVTFFICMAGLVIGKKFGMTLAKKASVLGGILLIGIGVEVFIKGILL